MSINKMRKSESDSIVRAVRGDFCSSLFIPWVRFSTIQKNEAIITNNDVMLTHTLFLDWFVGLVDIIDKTNYGGCRLDTNWYRRYGNSDFYTKFVLFNDKLNNRVITSVKQSRDINLNIGVNQNLDNLKISEWGIISKENLLITFLSHKYYTNVQYKKYRRNYEDEITFAKYEIKRLLNDINEVYLNDQDEISYPILDGINCNGIFITT